MMVVNFSVIDSWSLTMLCYKDTTYCNANCAVYMCPIMLTERVQEDADKFGLPIMQSDFSADDGTNIPCEDYRIKDDKISRS